LYSLPKDKYQLENISATVESAVISNYLLALPAKPLRL
jgi:hypothetical protein